jgi:hypothetical protein
MGEMLSWVTANWQMVVGTAGAVVMGASIVVKAIAPLTSNTADDRAASWLNKVHGWLSKIALNPPKV